MTNPWTVSRLGQSNKSGTNQALFDDVFVNQVRHTFETSTKFLGLTRKRMISKGKGATFPQIGRITGKFHVPGVDVVANTIGKAEVYVPVDQLIVAPAVTANIDEWMSEIDYRTDYGIEIGSALGRIMDMHIAYAAFLGARSASSLTERTGGATGGQTGASGGQVTDDLAAANADTDAATLFGLISNAVRILDEKDVPAEDRFTILRPAQFHMLLKAGHITMDRDFGGMGSAATATMPMIWGTQVVVSNQVPISATGGATDGTAGTTNGGDPLASTGETGGNDYSGDFADSVALVGQRQAMGTVVLKDVDMESEYSVARQATLMLGRYAVGHSVLVPECLCEITKRDIAA